MAERAATDGARLTLRAPHVIHEAIDGEVIVIHLERGSYFSLRDTAAELWELVEQGCASETTSRPHSICRRTASAIAASSAARSPLRSLARSSGSRAW